MINPNATWIDVNEFMPPDNIKVIVRAINKENEAFYYGAYFSYPENRWYFIAYGDGSENLSVTHWMREPEILPSRPAEFPDCNRIPLRPDIYASPSEEYIENTYGDTK